MRTISVETITEAVCKAAVEANTRLPEDIRAALTEAIKNETNPRAKEILGILIENAEIANNEGLALCQDTGLVVVAVEVGNDVHIDGSLQNAINEGIRRAYLGSFFRASVVRDPLNRVNTGDNTPCIIHTELIEGDKLDITVFPKGAGSENMGRVAMLKPGAGEQGVIDFVLDAVRSAGGNPCPPMMIGIGIGGNLEYAPYLAKKAMMRPLGQAGPYPAIERKIKDLINDTGIGPQGLGGNTTALGVHIETYPTHIASLPVAVNLGCHSTRRCRICL